MTTRRQLFGLLTGAAALPLVARIQPASAADEIGPWIHTPDDGRGIREVYLDGRRLEFVVYADERRGIARMHKDPLQVVCGEVVTIELRGNVRVVAVERGRYG